MIYNCLYCSKEISEEEFNGHHGECLECIKKRLDKVADTMDKIEKIHENNRGSKRDKNGMH